MGRTNAPANLNHMTALRLAALEQRPETQCRTFFLSAGTTKIGTSWQVKQMTSRMAMAAALGLLAGSGATPAAPLNYDCDTNEGSYSRLSQIQTGPGYHVRGTITPLQVRSHERFLPSAQVRLENPSNGATIALQIVSMQADDNFDIVVALGRGANSDMERTVIGTTRMNEPLPFDLSVSPGGDAIVAVGRLSRQFRLNVEGGAELAVICSTGEFEFGDLVRGD